MPKRIGSAPAGPVSESIAEYLRHLSPTVQLPGSPPSWPPDVFALVTSLLQDSGAYRHVLDTWPPVDRCPGRDPAKWVAFVRDVGLRWRQSCVQQTRTAPQEVANWWSEVAAVRDVPVRDLLNHRVACEAILHLCAAADEAALGVGLPAPAAVGPDDFASESVSLLRKNDRRATLCRDVPPSRVLVLPKLHTPQNGITIRSLSHNLALCRGADLDPVWQTWPGGPARESLNLLLIPWPAVVRPASFIEATPRSGSLRNMPARFGMFACQSSSASHSSSDVIDLLEGAKNVIGRGVDGVILPELALSPASCHELSEIVINRQAFFLSGVGEAPRDDRPGRNYLVFRASVGQGKYAVKPENIEQDKHHRWLLDPRQIVQYGLGGNLNPSRSWWSTPPSHLAS